MPKKPTFVMRDRNFRPIGYPVAYHPLPWPRPDGKPDLILALHRVSVGNVWCLSEPLSGAALGVLEATYKGCPISSSYMTLTMARQQATAQLDRRQDKMGSTAFFKVLDDAIARASTFPAANPQPING